ncbi:MAG: hypothetical protein L6R42_005886 [Xanthoria sp. 1 TBL-2021]|nr:MAG: hypothetical protein L6R42_005886 [Xanthoria sp. 1 TBL-2021]
MSDTPQKKIKFLPIETRMILSSRGAKDWNSKAAKAEASDATSKAEPTDATGNEFDLDGPMSFESLAQVVTRQRRELTKDGILKDMPTDVYPKDIEAKYTRLRSKYPHDHDEMMGYLERNSGPNDGMTMSKQRRQSTTTAPSQPLTAAQEWGLPKGPQGARKKKVVGPETALSRWMTGKSAGYRK